tara:strand:+ start:806 stop:1051 length:246 start_codon:yes stop_codon:yes gene_type:complete
MNIKKDIREKLNKYLDKKIAKGDPYIFNEAVNFIKKDRAEQLILHGVSKSVAKKYAKFCVECDRKGLPLLLLDDYIEQYCC